MVAATLVHARMAWLLLLRRKLLFICAAMALLPAVASAVLVVQGNGGHDLYDNMMALYFYFLVPFVPTLLLASAVGDEVDGKTHTFLFSRPAPRPAMLLGKWLSATTAAMVMMAAALALAWGLSLLRLSTDLGPELIHFLRTELAAALGVAAFGAVALALGSVFVRHPLVAALIYLLVIEATLGSAPLLVNVVALSWHLRNLADLGQPSNFGPAAHLPAALSALIVGGVAAAALALASLKIKNAEF